MRQNVRIALWAGVVQVNQTDLRTSNQQSYIWRKLKLQLAYIITHCIGWVRQIPGSGHGKLVYPQVKLPGDSDLKHKRLHYRRLEWGARNSIRGRFCISCSSVCLLNKSWQGLVAIPSHEGACPEPSWLSVTSLCCLLRFFTHFLGRF